MYRPALSCAVALTVLGLATAGSATGAKPDCKDEGKEPRGCTLPNGTSYQVTKGQDDEWNLERIRGKSTLAFRDGCARNDRGRVTVGSLKVGGKSRIDTTTRVKGSSTTTTYAVKLTVKVTSATRATVKGTVSASAPAAPQAGEDEYRCDSSVNRTLKRVVGD